MIEMKLFIVEKEDGDIRFHGDTKNIGPASASECEFTEALLAYIEKFVPDKFKHKTVIDPMTIIKTKIRKDEHGSEK